MSQRIRSYRDLEVWQRSMNLVTEIYRLTRSFPADERFGLTAQLRRAAVSIPANLAEGAGRSGASEYHRFVSIARGSAAEVETLLEIGERLAFAAADEFDHSRSLLAEVGKMLTGLRRRLRPEHQH
jgi:four helix bundle protein